MVAFSPLLESTIISSCEIRIIEKIRKEIYTFLNKKMTLMDIIWVPLFHYSVLNENLQSLLFPLSCMSMITALGFIDVIKMSKQLPQLLSSLSLERLRDNCSLWSHRSYPFLPSSAKSKCTRSSFRTFRETVRALLVVGEEGGEGRSHSWALVCL